jgi:hypothetical protein
MAQVYWALGPEAVFHYVGLMARQGSGHDPDDVQTELQYLDQHAYRFRTTVECWQEEINKFTIYIGLGCYCGLPSGSLVLFLNRSQCLAQERRQEARAALFAVAEARLKPAAQCHKLLDLCDDTALLGERWKSKDQRTKLGQVDIL